MSHARPVNGAHTIPMVSKTLDLVRLLAAGGADTGTKALAARLGLPRSSCYRILRSLIAQDWVRIVAGGRHELSVGLLPLLDPLRKVETLAGAVGPALNALTLRAHLTAKVSVRQGDHAVTVARCESPQETSVAVRVGAAFHLAFGSSGAVLLSAIDAGERKDLLERAPGECWLHQEPEDVRRRLKELQAKGWCADHGSFRASCHAVSAPLRDSRGRILAAMTLIGFPHEMPGERIAVLAKLLLEAAAQAEKELRKLDPTPAARRKPSRKTR